MVNVLQLYSTFLEPLPFPKAHYKSLSHVHTPMAGCFGCLEMNKISSAVLCFGGNTLMFRLLPPLGVYARHPILQVVGPVDRARSKVLPPFNFPSATRRYVSVCGVTLKADVFGFQVCIPVQPVAPAEGTGGVWLHQQEGEPWPDQADHPHPQQGQPSAQYRPGKIFLPYLLQPPLAFLPPPS